MCNDHASSLRHRSRVSPGFTKATDALAADRFRCGDADLVCICRTEEPVIRSRGTRTAGLLCDRVSTRLRHCLDFARAGLVEHCPGTSRWNHGAAFADTPPAPSYR